MAKEYLLRNGRFGEWIATFSSLNPEEQKNKNKQMEKNGAETATITAEIEAGRLDTKTSAIQGWLLLLSFGILPRHSTSLIQPSR